MTSGDSARADAAAGGAPGRGARRGRKPGRRPGGTGTRAAILGAARQAFADLGFEGATVREIAARAGVDPAMIHHYFGSKEKLFLAAVDVPFDPADFLASAGPVPRDAVGEHVVRSLVRAWDSVAGAAVLALLRSAFRSRSGALLLRELVLARILRPVLSGLEPDPVLAEWRAALAASQLAGLALTRYVLRLEPLAGASPEAIVAAIAPQVQHYLTGPVPPPPAPAKSGR